MKSKKLFLGLLLLFAISSNYAQQIGSGYPSGNITSFNTNLVSGFYQGENVPGGQPGWSHLLNLRHSTTTNTHQLQIMSSYGIDDKMYFRKFAYGTLGTFTPTWYEIATRGVNTFIGDQTINGAIVSSISSNEGGSISILNPSKTTNIQANKWQIYNMTGQYGNSLQFWSYGIAGYNSGSKLTILDNGNVGIGTTNPTSKLQVAGSTQISDAVASADTASYATFGVTRNNSADPLAYIAMTRSGNTVKAMGIDANNTWLFGTPQPSTQLITSVQMAITTAGKVGIGTTTPTEKLQVNGTLLATTIKKQGGTSNQFLMADGSTTTSTVSQNFTSFKTFGNNGQYVPVVFQTTNTDSGNKPINISRPSVHEDRQWLAHGLATITAVGFGWGSGGNSIRLDNFTYGRTNADSSGADISFVGRVVVDWGGSAVIVFLRGGTTYYTDGMVIKNDGAFADVGGQQNFSSVLITDPLYNIPKGTYYSDFDITKKSAVFAALASGNVGIGTTNPDEKLTVKGKIHAQEVIVDLQGAVAPDYVFQKYYTGKSALKSDYTIPTLAEIENFTKKNHHLPNVPSAKEIKEKGMQLGEMSNLLLQKIEELTLYVIEQQKEIENLKKAVSR